MIRDSRILVVETCGAIKGQIMEAMGILGFVFGLIAFVRVEKLTKTLKEKGIIEENYKEEQCTQKI